MHMLLRAVIAFTTASISYGCSPQRGRTVPCQGSCLTFVQSSEGLNEFS